MQTQNQIVGPDTMTITSAAIAHSSVPIAIGSLAVSVANQVAI